MKILIHEAPDAPVMSASVDSICVYNDDVTAKRLAHPVARVTLTSDDTAEMWLNTELAADMVTGLLDFLIENADDVPTREARSISYLAGLLADARVFEEVKS